MGSDNKLEILQYLVDTRDLWPAAKQTKDLEHEASRALALLPDDERAAVLRYYFVADAKMSLASHLLKHWAVSRCAGVPWASTRLSRDANKKPVYVDAATGRQPVSFNVSHQAGVVALVASRCPPDVELGVDVVCTSERRARDHRVVRAEGGWARFVDMHADVFGRAEAAYLREGLVLQEEGEEEEEEEAAIDRKLRCFYALWCLREAYIKMTGEALLAAWLPDLEFRGFRAPAPAAGFAQRDGDGDGTTIRTHDIWFRGEKVDDANVCLRALGPDYMTCTAVRTPARKEVALACELGPFEFLSIEEILAHAEASASA
ncbi:phosphopantetheinyl transferase [Biscogniauxia mediterranea]|nr:phosphopantetheinyl transferase [Biscogniauxia mediterranea]